MTLSAPTRLHFGLLNVHPPFGGLGTMLEEPRVSVTLEPASEMIVDGTLARRARHYAPLIAAKLGIAPCFRITANGPSEHVGLGVGTALGLALAEGLLRMTNATGDIAALAGRGERSRIGTRGFHDGGFHYDAGHGAEHLSRRFDVPPHWRFALVNCPHQSAWHGDRERAAFARSRDAANTAERLAAIVHQRLLPALERGEFAEFAAALADYNRIAGEPFAADQGGMYASPAIAGTIARLERHGFRAGQSSWGPTVFAMVDTTEAEAVLRTLVEVDCVSSVATAGVR
jgi:beta-RFAP synthase